MSINVAYEDAATKHAMESWADDKEFAAEEQLVMHLEERFDVTRVRVLSAETHPGFLMLRLLADSWDEPREFALMDDGAISW